MEDLSGRRSEEIRKGPFTYIDMDILAMRARIHGQDGVAFHLAMARDALLSGEFGSLLSTRPAVVERVVREEMKRGDV